MTSRNEPTTAQRPAGAGASLTRDAIREVVLRALKRLAPETDPASIDPGVSFRDQLDLDSIDYLNFMLALHDALGVEIPDVDAPRLSTIDGAVAYLESRGIKAPA